MMKAHKLKRDDGSALWKLWGVEIEGRKFILDGQNGNWTVVLAVEFSDLCGAWLTTTETKREAMLWLENNWKDI